jgi:hypothetical protein
MPALPQRNDSLGSILSRGFQAIDNFFFRPADPTTLGLIRLLCGLTVLYVHFGYSFDLPVFFGRDAWLNYEKMDALRKEGPTIGMQMGWNDRFEENPALKLGPDYQKKWLVDPSLVIYKGHPALWSLWYHITDPTWMWVTHITILAVMLLFALGCCTRVTAVLTWVAMVSYINRSPTSLFGMDTIMIVVVTYLMIGPSGAALSVDRLIARYWGTYEALRRHQPVPNFSQPAPSVSANFAIRMMQIHVCIIYAMSGFSKLQGPPWWSGTAVWYTVANPEFSPMGVLPYMAFLRFISGHRWLWELVMMGGCYGTLFFEISFPYLIWAPRMRWGMIAMAVGMHISIALCMGLVTFSMMMLVLVLSFVPPTAVRQLLGLLGRGTERPMRLAPALG